MLDVIAARPWFIDSLLWIFLVLLVLLLGWGVIAVSGKHIREFVELFRQERNESMARSKTLGAINYLCIKVLAVVGLVLIVGTEIKEILVFLTKWLPSPEHAKELHDSANAVSLFYWLAVVMLVSLLAVLADNRNRRR